MATTEIKEDRFICSVCFNYMLDRNPRSLSCLHTFCENCLNQLMNNKKITCPTCREITELKKNNVQELRINFHLKDMLETPPNSTTESLKSYSPCVICKSKPPVYTCNECSKMCEGCKDGHDDMYRDQGHIVYEMCVKHEVGITHLCNLCEIPLCKTCGLLDHKHHKTRFVDFMKGTREMEDKGKTLLSVTNEEIGKIDSHLQQSTSIHDITLNIEKNLTEQENYYREKIQEIEKFKIKVKTKSEEYERIQKACIETRDHCRVSAASLKALTADNPGFCNRYSQIRPRAQEVIEEAERELQVKYKLPPFALTDHEKKPLAVNIKEIKQNRTKLVKEALLLDVPKTNEINCQGQIDFIEDDVLLITYNNPEHVVRLNREREVVARYYPKVKGQCVRGLSVHANRIYIVQQKAITVISHKHGEKTLVYEPDIPNIDKIIVIDKSTIIISDYKFPGKVYKYNIESNQTEAVLRDLNEPFYMSVMYTLQGPRYILTEYGEHRINIYDQRWHILKTIGGCKGSGEGEFDCPRATAVTECGLLVADAENKRISHYSLEGNFLGHVITEQDGLNYNPYGIAYKNPFLWVCGNGKPVKCYQVKYQNEYHIWPY